MDASSVCRIQTPYNCCWLTDWLTVVLLCCRLVAVGLEQLQTQRWRLRSFPRIWSCTPSQQGGCHVWPLPTVCSNKCSSGKLLHHSISGWNTHFRKYFFNAVGICIRKCSYTVWLVNEPCVSVCVSVRYQGYIGAALVLGGVDCNGPHLYSIYPHGSTDKLPYVTMGQSFQFHFSTCFSYSKQAWSLNRFLKNS